MLTSRICNRADFAAPWFQQWRPAFASHRANGVQLGKAFLHRKEWEFAITAQALHERGMLCTGKRGLGFAVGLEPLPALFASRGCDIVASDYPDTQRGVWSGQWASGKLALHRSEICPDPIVDAHVRFERVDMRNIPADLTDFDFNWSCCALEHLGSLQAGLDFLRAQFSCLRPGGIAVHSFEFNLSSDRETIESGHTVLYRKRDVEDLIATVVADGHSVAAFDFRVGATPEDTFLAVRPFHDLTKNLAHLRLRIGEFVATSVVLIMARAGS